MSDAARDAATKGRQVANKHAGVSSVYRLKMRQWGPAAGVWGAEAHGPQFGSSIVRSFTTAFATYRNHRRVGHGSVD
jgi:hypothetical protein